MKREQKKWTENARAFLYDTTDCPEINPPQPLTQSHCVNTHRYRTLAWQSDKGRGCTSVLGQRTITAHDERNCTTRSRCTPTHGYRRQVHATHSHNARRGCALLQYVPHVLWRRHGGSCTRHIRYRIIKPAKRPWISGLRALVAPRFDQLGGFKRGVQTLLREPDTVEDGNANQFVSLFFFFNFSKEV